VTAGYRGAVKGIGLVMVAAALGVVTACGSSATKVSHAYPLSITVAPTPPLAVRQYVTEGTFPQLPPQVGMGIDARAVNAALRDAVLADQEAYAPVARKWRRIFARDNSVYAHHPGLYATAVDPKLLSASSVVISALLPTTRDRSRGEGGWGWLTVTVDVRTARRVSLRELLGEPSRAMKALTQAWIEKIRDTPCGWNYRSVYPTARFALLPAGVAVAVPAAGACGRGVATVPYHVVQPYLNALGRSLVDGVRSPTRPA
jgi:hypothetical protein